MITASAKGIPYRVWGNASEEKKKNLKSLAQKSFLLSIIGVHRGDILFKDNLFYDKSQNSRLSGCDNYVIDVGDRD